jgi:hypothetical protein
VICKEVVDAAIVNVSVAVAETGGDSASVTLKFNDTAFAAAVGVPLMTPVDAFSERPAGIVPLVRAHVYGVVPPVAASVVLYGEPTVPFGKELVVILTVEVIVRASVTVLDTIGDSESLTLKLNEAAFAAAVGVPLITPLDALRESPAGSVPLVIAHT